ncbi:MAG: PhzF family phenazine biosynthesis protein [Bacillota bacterium]
MSREWAYTWVDVFAARPLAGNQLCAFTGADGMDEELMFRLTRELGHSETTFLQRPTVPGADARLRIWIPTTTSAYEAPFAGHPILGSACAFTLAAGRVGPSTVRFETGVGLVNVSVEPAGEGAWEATMTQPLPRVVWSRASVAGLAGALGLGESDLRPGLPVEAVDNGMQTVIIPLASVEAVDRCRPDLAALRELLGRDGLCTLVFAPGGIEPGSDLHCRVFSPFDLVAEDPATGSANGPLGEYVDRHKLLTENVLVSEQGDRLGRPSRIRIALERGADGAVRTIRVAGRVHLIGRGSFRG